MNRLLYVCSSNRGKVREFELAAREYDAPCAVRVLPRIDEIPAPEETGKTFEENAQLKARYYAQWSTELVLADDSGLEVDMLGGAPGVLSARFAGPDANDRANNELLIKRLRAAENRTARFACVLALTQAAGEMRLFRGTIEGEILQAPRGTGGFGYDPLFYHPPSGKTLAELEADAKLAVSHRGQAMRKLLAYLADDRELARSS